MNLSFYHWFHLGESRIYPLYHLDESRYSFLVSLTWTFFVMSCLIFVIPSTRLLMGFYWYFPHLCFIFMSPFYSASLLPLKDYIGFTGIYVSSTWISLSEYPLPLWASTAFSVSFRWIFYTLTPLFLSHLYDMVIEDFFREYRGMLIYSGSCLGSMRHSLIRDGEMGILRDYEAVFIS